MARPALVRTVAHQGLSCPGRLNAYGRGRTHRTRQSRGLVGEAKPGASRSFLADRLDTPQTGFRVPMASRCHAAAVAAPGLLPAGARHDGETVEDPHRPRPTFARLETVGNFEPIFWAPDLASKDRSGSSAGAWLAAGPSVGTTGLQSTSWSQNEPVKLEEDPGRGVRVCRRLDRRRVHPRWGVGRPRAKWRYLA